MNDHAVAKQILEYSKGKEKFYASDIACEYLIPYSQVYRVLQRLLAEGKVEFHPPKAEQDKKRRAEQ